MDVAEDIGELLVRISANTRGLEDGLEKVNRKVDGVGGNLKKFGAMVAGAFAVGAITSFAGKMVTAASDAAEMQSKFNTVFSSMSKDAEAWASNFRNKVGGSRVEIKGMLADSQDLLTGFGATTDQAFDFSTKMQSLGTDLASFQNLQGGAGEAVDRLRKGLLGETENLKAMGIVINENIMMQELASRGDTRKIKDLTELEKIELRYAIALKQSKNAIGDAEKTSGGYANQMRNLKGQIADATASLGEFFLPIATKVVTFLSDKIPAVQEIFTNFFSNIGGSFEGFGPIINTYVEILSNAFNFIKETVFPPVLDIFNFFATEVVPMLAAKFQEWIPTIVDILQGAWKNIELILTVLVAAFKFAWPYIKDIIFIAIDTISSVIGGLLKVLSGVIDFVTGVFTGDWEKAWGGIEKIFSGVWEGIAAVLKGVVNQIIAAINFMTRQLNKISFSIPDWVPRLGGKSFGINLPEVPKLAKGTNFVPFDTLAYLHRGEAVVPARNNPANPGASASVGIDYERLAGAVASKLAPLINHDHPINIDGQRAAKALWSPLVGEKQRLGVATL